LLALSLALPACDLLAVEGARLVGVHQVDPPPPGPEATCAKSCSVRAGAQCTPSECARGCNFVLDRLAEHEGDAVLACMASSRACDDPAWARCAVRIGPHADGGPPAPPPPPTDVLEDQE
jgi:hypothetical protein